MLRAKYLFDLARICHLGPREVGVMRYLDFLAFTRHIDAMYEQASQEGVNK
jgi:hypothetical protein